jgi:hypothetical protein
LASHPLWSLALGSTSPAPRFSLFMAPFAILYIHKIRFLPFICTTRIVLSPSLLPVWMHASLQDDFELHEGKEGVIDGRAPQHWRERAHNAGHGAFHGMQVCALTRSLPLFTCPVCQQLQAVCRCVSHCASHWVPLKS